MSRLPQIIEKISSLDCTVYTSFSKFILAAGLAHTGVATTVATGSPLWECVDGRQLCIEAGVISYWYFDK